MKAPHRRDACPGLAAPMPTGDGLLTRFMTTAPIALGAFAGLCAAARRDGNGTIEISARGSLQVRGLTEESAPRFAAAVARLGIAAHDGRVIASPLNDALGALIDADALAAKLRNAIEGTELSLPPKFSIVIDGGGSLHLDALRADIRLRVATPDGDLLAARGEMELRRSPPLHVFIGGKASAGHERGLGSVALHEAPAAVLALLRAIAVRGERRTTGLMTTADSALCPEDFGIASLAERAVLQRGPAKPVGRHALRDGTRAIGVALAFGHASAEALAELASCAATCGARAIRPAPGRALLLIAVALERAATLQATAAKLGFIVDPEDPRQRIVACPGAPACAAGLIAARAIAGSIATARVKSDIVSRRGFVHISGCSKGCAHPRTAALTVVGTERGCGIVRNGTARDTPSRYVSPADLAAIVADAVTAQATAAEPLEPADG